MLDKQGRELTEPYQVFLWELAAHFQRLEKLMEAALITFVEPEDRGDIARIAFRSDRLEVDHLA